MELLLSLLELLSLLFSLLLLELLSLSLSLMGRVEMQVY
jgi:hypothetical protein